MNREVEFAAELWDYLKRYLEKYTINGHKLRAEPPSSVVLKGKVPDIVVVDSRGLPQLIIETKRKAEGKPSEELLNPLSPAPIAQAVCYAALAVEEYNLSRSPMFATANRDALILFKGINRDELDKIVNTRVCLEPKRAPEDWAKALMPGGLEALLKDYIIDRIEHPLKDESLKKLFEYVGKWLVQTPISPATFYKVFVSQLRSSIENLHEYVRDAVKIRIIDDREYFVKLYNKAKEMGYPLGLLSKGLLELVCPSHSKKICEYLKEVIEEELSKLKEVTPEKAFEILSNTSRKHVVELCSEAKKSKGIDTSSIPLCTEPKRVEDLISFDNLSRMMTYVLANKILAYKILELHYGDHLPLLKPIHYGETVKVNNRMFEIKSPNDLIAYLNYLYSYASSKLEKVLGVKDFSPIFRAGLYDDILLSGVESIVRINAIIDLVDSWKHELKYLPGIIGYVYEGLLPPKERHQLGQFYTPPAIARLITKWAVRSDSDRVLDAGCGSGTFLIEAYKGILKLKFNKDYDKGQYPSCTEKYNEHQEVLNQLYGIDINAFASHITGIHLMLMEPRCPISKLNVETKDYFTLKKGGYAFGELIKGFDAVIGNPPYTRWVEIPDEIKDNILKMLDDVLAEYDLKADLKRGREPGIYVYWVMHTVKNLLNEHGRVGMIISNMWLQTDYGIDFGKFLLDNFRIISLIDLSFRLFEALISTVIILAEKEPDSNKRENNTVTLIRVPPKIKGEELDLEKTGKVLNDALRCIEDSIRGDGSIDTATLTRCRDEYGIQFIQLRQSDIPRDRKWISLFFASIEDVLNELAKHSLMIRLSEWFEPSRGNSVWSIWALSHGRRPDLGAKDFFYFSEEKIAEWEVNRKVPGFRKAIEPYLVPAITRSQYVKTFTFTKEDWENLEKKGKDAYIFVCHEHRSILPQQVQEYIKWGETDCKTEIRGTRGGGRKCSEAEACKAREKRKVKGKYFYGWYDLGGYIPTPVMAIYQPRYHPQFFLATMPNLVTYHAIITLIPRVKVKTHSITYDPNEYNRIYGNIIDHVKPGVELDEAEVKALLAYLNSTFNWLWLEQNARYIAKGPLGLEVNILRDMPVINVKKINRADISELAKLFDELESRARQLAKNEEEIEEKEEKVTKLKMFEELKPYFQAIDRKIAEMLGVSVDVEWLWSSAWEMMERRIKGARGPMRPGAEVSLEIDVGGKRRSRRGRSSSSSATITLDKWFKLGGK